MEPIIEGTVRVNEIVNKFQLKEQDEMKIRNTPYFFGFNGLSETVFYRTYSRMINGKKETWPDVIVRVINGIISVCKNWYILHNLEWNENYWDEVAVNMGCSMMKMEFLPPGRGLYICGTEFMYKKGGCAMNNCAFVSTIDNISSNHVTLIQAATFLMDSLMHGCGVGFDTYWRESEESYISLPGCLECRFKETTNCKCGNPTEIYHIHDSREGWVLSLSKLLYSYFNGNKKVIHFDYSQLRKRGEPIKTFGGVSSGPEPLKILHDSIRNYMEAFILAKTEPYEASIFLCQKTNDQQSIDKINNLRNIVRKVKYDPFSLTNDDINIINKIISSKTTYKTSDDVISERDKILQHMRKTYTETRLIADIFNSIGVCVISGNVRRSSEIILGSPNDIEFVNLKNYYLNPEREYTIGYMSNNTVVLKTREEFSMLPEIAQRIKDNGEPGIFNMINTAEYGRIGKKISIGRENENDNACGLNPCVTGDCIVNTTQGNFRVKDLVGIKFETSVKGTKAFSTDDGFWSNGIKKVYKIVLDNETIIKATENHKFMCWTDDRNLPFNANLTYWTQTKDLTLSSYLVSAENFSKYYQIIEISYYGEEEVFDCTVPGIHCYSLNGIISHNCGEITLESYEFCNLAEIFVPRCDTYEKLVNAAECATIYASIVSLLQTHWLKSNSIIARNRRIGISLSGLAEIYDKVPFSELTSNFRNLYKIVRKTNQKFSKGAGIAEAIRVTTIKPSGSISLLVGCSPGLHYPIYNHYIRRVRIDKDSDLVPLLKKSGYHFEDDVYTPNTLVFSFPISQNKCRVASNVSMWEQISIGSSLQREWSDNSISQTLYFNPRTEGKDLEHLLSQFCPIIKTLSVMPQSDLIPYAQAPYEEIDEEKYLELSRDIKPILWDNLSDDSIGVKYCDNDKCIM